MPRPLLFGNQSLLVACDGRHRLRELTWPYAGQLNHLSGKAIAWGIYADGAMHWVDSEAWEITLSYRKGSQVAECRLVNHEAGLEIRTTEACHPFENWFIRSAKIRSLKDEPRDIKVFWNHELLIDESSIGNSALYHPDLGGMVHSKRDIYLGFFARAEGKGPDQWSCGVRLNPGEGSWRQCATGFLNGQAAEVGAVDSTMGISLTLPPYGDATVDWCLTAATSLSHLEAEAARCLKVGAKGVIEERQRQDLERLAQAQIPAEEEELPGSRQASELALLTLSSMMDRSGAILAGCDSDIMGGNTLNYSNVWPRDGSLVADALFDAGEMDLVDRWLRWCRRALELQEGGLFQQKYWPDGTKGVSWHPLFRLGQRVKPIQLDESSLTLSLACRWSLAGREPFPFVKALADEILAFRQPNGLPSLSWDLWEERRGVSFFAVCSTITALEKAGQALEREDLAEAAAKMRQAALNLMVGPDGAFVRELDEAGRQDPTPDSALAAGLLQGCFDWTLDPVRATIDKVRRFLLDRSPSGGCARYEGDYYHRRTAEHPGSPWIISTLWLAQVELRAGGSREEALRLTRWAMQRAESTGLLPESCHPVTGEPLSVSPLTWSHAELLRTLCLLATSDRG